MNASELKLKIFRQLDTLDSSKLEEFYGIMLNYVNSKKDIDEWIGVTDTEKQEIETAIKELDLGKGIPHEQVMHNLRKKYSHD